MKRFKIAIRESEKNKDGLVNIKIMVRHQRATRYISTDYYCDPTLFDQDKELLKPGGEYSIDDVDHINSKLQIQLGVVVQKAKDLKNLKTMDIKSLMNILRDKRPEYGMFAVLDSRMENYKKVGNINYHDTILRTKRAIENYCGTSLLPFENITPAWLSGFEFHLRTKVPRFVSFITLLINELSDNPIFLAKEFLFRRKWSIIKFSRSPTGLISAVLLVIFSVYYGNKSILYVNIT